MIDRIKANSPKESISDEFGVAVIARPPKTPPLSGLYGLLADVARGRREAMAKASAKDVPAIADRN